MHKIFRFGHEADGLLDLACGRGGDIWKWIDSRIKYVKGLDLSPGEIEEAKQRYQEAQKRRKNMVTQCEFVDTPNLGIEEWREPRQYDIATCMFALHYFFVSEAALFRFLKNVAINLKEGGYFVGTVPDGKRVNEYAVRLGNKGVFSSPLLYIEAKWHGAPATFGSPYICAIGDTVTGGEKNTSGSYEYLVYSNVLVGVAAQVGLEPVIHYGDPDLENCFEAADKDRLLKHFDPHFPGSDESLEKASRLFAAFVFRKVKSQQPSCDNGALPQKQKSSAVNASGDGIPNPKKRKMSMENSPEIKPSEESLEHDREKGTKEIGLASISHIESCSNSEHPTAAKSKSQIHKRPCLESPPGN